MTTLFRMIKIARICARYRLDTLLSNNTFFYLIALLIIINPRCWTVCKRLNRGQRLRLGLETLGPIYVKFGQILSTRRDLLPDDIADELAKLQDQVPPFPTKTAITMMEAAYKKPINEVFKTISPEPLASASIAQVYAGVLHSGEDIVVKILRPNVTKYVSSDIKVLTLIARTLELISKRIRRFRPSEVVEEFKRTVFSELDLIREGANASALRRNFEGSDIIRVPKVYFDYTHENILVLERFYGIKISEIDMLKSKGVNMEKLARNGVEIFMTQVFRDSFFHADMHPGNILVDIKDPENPVYCAVDFGIMGSLSDSDKYYMAENFLAFFNADYLRISELHVESSWVAKKTNVHDFAAAIRSVCEPIFQKPMNEISFGEVLIRLFQISRQFDLEVQPQLILLQKTLLNIEGLGRQLYPELDLWDTVYPYLKNSMKERYSIKNFLKKCKHHLPFIIDKFPEMPEVIYNYLTKEEK